MPGNSVKNWATYHALRKKGYTKESAAKISNWQAGEGGSGGGRKGKRRRKGRG
jgi:hypothetical protein